METLRTPNVLSLIKKNIPSLEMYKLVPKHASHAANWELVASVSMKVTMCHCYAGNARAR